MVKLCRLTDLPPIDAEVPLFALDVSYGSAGSSYSLADVLAQVLVRISSDRVFYADRAYRVRRTKGQARNHARSLARSYRRTQHRPDPTLQLSDALYGTVTVAAWHHFHPRLPRREQWAEEKDIPIVNATVTWVEVEPPKRDGQATQTCGCGCRVRTPPLGAVLQGLPAPFRSGVHLPSRQEHHGLNRPDGAHARAGRPLELAHR